MEEVEIEQDIDKYFHKYYYFELNSFVIILTKLCKDLKYLLLTFAFLIFLSIIYFNSYYDENIIDLNPLIKYVSDCKNSINYYRPRIFNDHPYISVCIAAKDMQDFIEANLLSIINQSFQDFEIIIVNDASEDYTENIIKRIQHNDQRIKIVTHHKKLGV